MSLGWFHSVCLSDNGELFSFGDNRHGQLGHSDNENCYLPKQISDIPRMSFVACGNYFTACIDEHGILWTFGQNNQGQLGLGHTENQSRPQKVDSLPFLSSVHCGESHCICIAINGSVWSFGRNDDGQLALGHFQTPQCSPVQVLLPDSMSTAVCGHNYSLFLANTGNVYSAGENSKGLGHCERKSSLTKIIDLPPISQISCGYSHSVFLTTEGDVYVAGSGGSGRLGLGSTRKQSRPVKVKDLPVIMYISCGRAQTRVIDKDGNVYGWGGNEYGSLGLEDSEFATKPTKIPVTHVLKFVEGGLSRHAIVKLTDGSMYSFGCNNSGQLGLGCIGTKKTPQLLDEKYHSICGMRKQCAVSKWKEAGLAATWPDQEVSNLQIIEDLVWNIYSKESVKNGLRVKAPEGVSWTNWKEIHSFFTDKQREIHDICNDDKIGKQKQEDIELLQNRIEELEKELIEAKTRLPLLIEEHEKRSLGLKQADATFKELSEQIKRLCENEENLESDFCALLQKKSLQDITEEEMGLLLWKMNLSEYQDLFSMNHINGDALFEFKDDGIWLEIGMKYKDVCTLLYYRKLMTCPGYVTCGKLPVSDCVVCYHNTAGRTLELIQECNLPASFGQSVEENAWTAPSLIYVNSFDEFNITETKDKFLIKKQLSTWKKIHKKHLKSLSSLE